MFPVLYLAVKNHQLQKHGNRISVLALESVGRFIVTPLRPTVSGWNVLKDQIRKEDQRLYPGDFRTVRPLI